MPRVRRQLPLFPIAGPVPDPLPPAIRVQAEVLLTDLLLAVFQATPPPNPTTEGASYGQNHANPSSAGRLH